MKALHYISFTLVIIGGLNWLFVGLFKWDVVGKIFGGMDGSISRIIYVLVGLAAIYLLFSHSKDCKYCGKNKMAQM